MNKTEQLIGYGYGSIAGASTTARTFEGAVPESELEKFFPRIDMRDLMYMGEDGWIRLATNRAIVNAVTGEALSVQSDGYVVHQYADVFGGMGLPIASCTSTKGGRVGVVQFGTADEVTTREGVTFQTKVQAVTSCDGSLATSFGHTTTLLRCMNQFGKSMREQSANGTIERARHTKYSLLRVDSMRRAFGLIAEVADEAAKIIDDEVRWTITPQDEARFFDAMYPYKVDGSTRSTNSAADKRAAVKVQQQLLFEDYAGTAFGLLQSYDAAERWLAKTNRGTDLAERDLLRTVNGTFDNKLITARKVLAGVMA